MRTFDLTINMDTKAFQDDRSGLLELGRTLRALADHILEIGETDEGHCCDSNGELVARFSFEGCFPGDEAEAEADKWAGALPGDYLGD